MTQFTCKGVEQINNRISFKHLYHSYLSAFFISAGVPYREFPEILIAKCRSRFYCTWFLSRAEDFESWREGPSKSGEKCSRRKVHMYDNVYSPSPHQDTKQKYCCESWVPSIHILINDILKKILEQLQFHYYEVPWLVWYI